MVYPFGFDCYKVFVPPLVVYLAMRLARRQAALVAWFTGFPYLIYW